MEQIKASLPHFENLRFDGSNLTISFSQSQNNSRKCNFAYIFANNNFLTHQKDVEEPTALSSMSVAHARTKITHYQLAT